MLYAGWVTEQNFETKTNVFCTFFFRFERFYAVFSLPVLCRRARAAKKPFRASLRSFPRNKIIHTIFVKPLQVVINRAMFKNNRSRCPFTRYHRLKLPHNSLQFRPPNTCLFDQFMLLFVGRKSTCLKQTLKQFTRLKYAHVNG